MRLLSSLAFLFVSHWSLATSATSLSDELHQLAIDELSVSGTPSLQFAIARDGQVIHSEAIGLADVENQVNAHRQSLYRSASVSKWFTAVAAMALMEEGQLKLDAPIQSYCDAFPDKGQKITARQILGHRSGIRHYVDHQAKIEAAKDPAEKLRLQLNYHRAALSSYQPSPTIQASLTTFAEDPLMFEPDSQWQYSSHAYRVLGCALEGASSTGYNQLLESTVFAPAGMSKTQADDARKLITHRVRGYRVKGGKLVHNAELRDVSDNLPGGGHLTTAEDLVKLAQAFAANRLVAKASRNMMTAIAQPLENREANWRDAIPNGERYGLGIMLFPSPWGTWYGHTGRQAGGSAIVMHHPEHNVSIAVLTNAKGWSGYTRFTAQLASAVLGANEEMPNLAQRD